MTEQPASPDRRRRHLMDPDNPRPQPAPGGMSLTSVQQWVMSVLAVFTILHMAVGLVLAAIAVDDANTAARAGLNVIAGIFGILAVVTGLAIHRRSVLSPWLLVGLLPGLAGFYVTFEVF